MDHLLSAKDARDILRVSLPMVCKLAQQGKLPCVRFGLPDGDSKRQKMSIRFKKTDVLAFIEAHYNGE
jgi:hypothetical protein